MAACQFSSCRFGNASAKQADAGRFDWIKVWD
jgi:hypothetical protein